MSFSPAHWPQRSYPECCCQAVKGRTHVGMVGRGRMGVGWGQCTLEMQSTTEQGALSLKLGRQDAWGMSWLCYFLAG